MWENYGKLIGIAVLYIPPVIARHLSKLEGRHWWEDPACFVKRLQRGLLGIQLPKRKESHPSSESTSGCLFPLRRLLT